MTKIMVTGGLGFIGSAVVRKLFSSCEDEVLIVDKNNYASSIESIESVLISKRVEFVKENICNQSTIEELILSKKPDKIIHLAAETHVDKSIDSPKEFMKSNIMGTYSLLEAFRKYLIYTNNKKLNNFVFHHVSTDEVFGDLGDSKDKFTETSKYDPSSPYSASKASSDHLVRAWGRTYDLPYIITNTSNNYGPYQHPEKLIPHIIISALSNKSLPLYGNGKQIRDWIYVEDHADALLKACFNGRIGETYNIGGDMEKKNIDVVKLICEILDKKVPKSKSSYKDQIEFVKDRPGHDLKYSIDPKKIKIELNWKLKETFRSGLVKTVDWYIENTKWWSKILKNNYKLKRQGEFIKDKL